MADVLKREYRAIVDAGFVLQVDAPDVPMMRNRQLSNVPFSDYRKHLALRLEALNHALQGIPEDRVRFHVCWGNTDGPHADDVPLRDIVDLVLTVNAQAYSIEAANPRHAHEWEVSQNVIAAPDCGFGTFSAWAPRAHPEIMWARFRSMLEGARLASERLWGGHIDKRKVEKANALRPA